MSELGDMARAGAALDAAEARIYEVWSELPAPRPALDELPAKLELSKTQIKVAVAYERRMLRAIERYERRAIEQLRPSTGGRS